MPTATCTKCPKTFTHPTETRAQQALRMHVGRTHKRNIIDNHPGVLRQRKNGTLVATTRGNLLAGEVDKIVAFIQAKRGDFTNRTRCLEAALQATGLNGKIKVNSSSVTRYYQKADHSGSPEVEKVKRKYTKKQPAPQHIHVNFCPNCGCNMQAVATGMAMAALK